MMRRVQTLLSISTGAATHRREKRRGGPAAYEECQLCVIYGCINGLVVAEHAAEQRLNGLLYPLVAW